MSDGGKGSAPRPFSVSYEKFDKNFRGIFGLSKLEKKKQQEALEELSRINQELGLYDDYDKITRYNEETQEIKK
jgi:hypothetical protein